MNRQPLQWFTGIAIVLLVVTTGCTNSPVVVDSSGQLRNVVSVQGTAELEVQPDRVEIVIGVTSLADAAKDAQSQNAAKIAAVLQALKDAGVPSGDIETTGVQLYPRYEWNELARKSDVVGYEARQTIQISTSRINDAGTLADAAVNAGASEISSITFALSKEAERKAREEALEVAMADAKAKAQILADAAGVTLGKPVAVSENFNIWPGPVFMRNEMDKAEDAGGSTPVVPGEVDFSGTVSVSYAIE